MGSNRAAAAVKAALHRLGLGTEKQMWGGLSPAELGIFQWAVQNRGGLKAALHRLVAAIQ